MIVFLLFLVLLFEHPPKYNIDPSTIEEYIKKMEIQPKRNSGRVYEIEQKNRELNGFLDLFAKLPSGSQARVLEEIANLKRRVGNKLETFLTEVKTLAEMYGAIARGTKGEDTNIQAFTAQLGEIARAASGLKDASERLNRKAAELHRSKPQKNPDKNIGSNHILILGEEKFLIIESNI